MGIKLCARVAAAQRLGVSLRTFDRYVKTGKLRSRIKERKVLVFEADLQKLLKAKLAQKAAAAKTQSTQAQPQTEAEFFEQVHETAKTESGSASILQKLYTQALTELKEKQEKLEAASFRVGQLESELKSSVPLLEFRTRENELHQANKVLEKRSRKMLFGLLGLSLLIVTLGLILLWQVF